MCICVVIRYDEVFPFKPFDGKKVSMTAVMAYECHKDRRNNGVYDRIAPELKINNQKDLFLKDGKPGE